MTPRHVLVWGSEVDLGRTWGDAGCALPRDASHPKAPACPSALPSSKIPILHVSHAALQCSCLFAALHDRCSLRLNHGLQYLPNDSVLNTRHLYKPSFLSTVHNM